MAIQRINKTNILHALYALAMQIPFAVYGAPWVGAGFAIGFFISREHAHRQVDIRSVTGVPVTSQNPLDGFRGWTWDSKMDALLPTLAVLIAGVIYGDL